MEFIFPSMPLVLPSDINSDNFDFIKENLERTLNQYQKLYDLADFKSEGER